MASSLRGFLVVSFRPESRKLRSSRDVGYQSVDASALRRKQAFAREIQTMNIRPCYFVFLCFQSSWIEHKRSLAFTVLASMLAGFSIASYAHESCPFLCKSNAECRSQAGWIVEGTIEKIIDEGSRNTCETALVEPFCREIKEPETIKLSKAKVLKGKFQLEPNHVAFVPRKYSCFNGVLSFMNSKPEYEKIGVRIRFFGNNERTPIYVRPGYYYLEDAAVK